jgi:hypothetical protein
VQRWVKFAKYLPAQGWQPVVYTPLNPERLAEDSSLMGDIPACAEVIRTPIREPYALYRRFFGGGASADKREVNPVSRSRGGWKKKLSLFLRGNLFVPDPRAGWVRPSVRFLLKYLEEHPVDAIVTTGPPQSMHLIGRDLCRALRRTGRPCPPWYADFRDPWTKMFYFKHLALLPWNRRRHERMEQSVLDEATRVISVSPPVRDDFQAATRTPVELITNGFDPADFPALAPGASQEFFTLVHTGLFAADGNPLNLWSVLSRMCSEDARFRECLRIRLAGKVDGEIVAAILAAGLGDQLENLGYMPHSAVTTEQQSAAVLLLPLRREPEYAAVLPGKIFEYLAARRPVLGIGQPDGAAAKVLRDAGAGEMYDWEETEPLHNFIKKEWRRWLDGDISPRSCAAEKYSRPELTKQLVAVLQGEI